jgi:hypothetical protein
LLSPYSVAGNFKRYWLQIVTDISEYFPQTVILAGIDNRIQNSQIDVERVFANQPFIHLDVPDRTEKCSGISGVQFL